MGRDLLHHKTVLRDRERVLADRLAVPARHARQAVGDVLDLDVERRGIEQVEPAARQTPLPGARGGVPCLTQPFRHGFLPLTCGADALRPSEAEDQCRLRPISGNGDASPFPWRGWRGGGGRVERVAGVAGDVERLESAAAVAACLDAELAVIFAPPDPAEATPWLGEGFAGNLQLNLAQTWREA